MGTHFENLLQLIPDLKRQRILDIGSGRGKFLIDATIRGVQCSGLEFNPAYIEQTYRLAKEQGAAVSVTQGAAEQLPFADASFDFINMSEVFEHVDDPARVMHEVYRVLVTGGAAYVSVPNRFALRDPHFHIYGVNWVPRRYAARYLSLFKKHKQYTREAGRQRLDEMHYRTYHAARRLFEHGGFTVTDIREKKIRSSIHNHFFSSAVVMLYWCVRPWYFDSFHFLLMKF